MEKRPEISVIVPVFNEQATLVPLHAQLLDVLAATGESFEVIFVDDGSTDDSSACVESLIARHPAVTLIRLRGNYGKSAALAAGFDHCRGHIIFTMDADLQDSPKEMPRFLAKLGEGYDLVNAYRRKRQDPWHKVYPSRVFNFLVRIIAGTQLYDVNCGFKCYDRRVIEEINLYGELHRFMPVLAHWRRFKIAEIAVEHYPRRFGVSKFGVGRFYHGLIDLFTIAFLMRYDRSPSRFFGMLGLTFSGTGFMICLYLAALWFTGTRPIGNRPLLFLGILLIIVGVQSFTSGFIAELLTYSLQRQVQPYSIDRILRSKDSRIEE